MRTAAPRTLALLTTLLLTACASGARPERQTVTIRQMLRLAGSHETDPGALAREVLVVDTVGVAPARAWAELLRAWGALRIPVTGVDEANLQIGGSTLPLGLIGGSKPSAWLECGHGMTDAYADSYQVTFSMASRVAPLDSISTVESIVRATARPRDVSTAPFRCTSLGSLEKRVVEAIRQRTGTRPPTSR
jgi:hypothetical protein